MRNLIDIIKEAEQNKKAIAHFNVANLEMLKAIINAAQRERTPVIIGVSEGERDFIGQDQIVSLIKSFQAEGIEVFLNADHTKSFEKAKKAVEADFDSITFDRANLSLEENINETKKLLDYVKKANPNILVEGEINPIWGASELLLQVPQELLGSFRELYLTKPEEAEKFVKETKVDLLAVAVGNMHGVAFEKNSSEILKPEIDIERLKAIKRRVEIPLVLHGGSGISEEDLIKAIEAGVSIVHINTELRISWRNALENSLKNNPSEIVPYKIMSAVVAEIEKIAEKKIRVLNRL